MNRKLEKAESEMNVNRRVALAPEKNWINRFTLGPSIRKSQAARRAKKRSNGTRMGLAMR
jgi:hypothetical protein